MLSRFHFDEGGGPLGALSRRGRVRLVGDLVHQWWVTVLKLQIAISITVKISNISSPWQRDYAWSIGCKGDIVKYVRALLLCYLWLILNVETLLYLSALQLLRSFLKIRTCPANFHRLHLSAMSSLSSPFLIYEIFSSYQVCTKMHENFQGGRNASPLWVSQSGSYDASLLIAK